MLTLFVMLTLENFPIYMEQGMDVYPWSWVYFVTFILIAAFVVLNVLIGVVLNSMEEAREVERRRARGIPEPELATRTSRPCSSGSRSCGRRSRSSRRSSAAPASALMAT